MRLDLVFHDELFYCWVSNPGPTVDFTKLEVEDVWDLGGEIVDVRIPVAVVRAGKEQLRVVIQEHPAHVVHRANQFHALIADVAMQAFQKKHACAWRRLV